ncbi:MAG: type II toxin-antitoxin system prevent-host-death family antitoxin [Acidimicrobiales bacterium]|nr:type II toxin-antitoxin system prevent-host-death family antitoxin [Acidimicrobiales bacterium]MCB9392587.1 type II toxin-antitoxin system prevent-host-death family antitoxin [Acidimicrobiaceae bacterium]
MTEVGIRALRQNASAVVAAAAAGESVTITEHGRPVPQLVPIARTRVPALIVGRHAAARAGTGVVDRAARRA